MPTITLDARFNGPPKSANGGYACGSIAVAAAELIAYPLSIVLRVPPPLDRPLDVMVSEDGEVVALNGDTVIATTRRFEGSHEEPPRSVSLAEAKDATSRYPGLDEHLFPMCWVCGPDRDPGDGLHLYPGSVPGATDGLVAAPWLPSADLDAGDGTVAVEQVWAALDCPSYFGAAPANLGVLGSLAVELRSPIAIGEPHIVVSWRTGEQDGRKIPAGSALLRPDGEIAALGTALWIELSDAQSAAMTARDPAPPTD